MRLRLFSERVYNTNSTGRIWSTHSGLLPHVNINQFLGRLNNAILWSGKFGVPLVHPSSLTGTFLVVPDRDLIDKGLSVMPIISLPRTNDDVIAALLLIWNIYNRFL